MAVPMSGDRADSVKVIEIVDSSPPHSPIGGKRKAEAADDASNPGKKAKASSLVELQGRKVVFSQSPFERPALPRRRLLELEMDLLDARDAGKPLEELPEKFWDLIVVAGHELTSASEAAFVKAIKAELIKGQEDLLPVELLADPVKNLFTLTHYGFTPLDFGVAQSRFPAGLQIRCWEAKNLEKYFPAEIAAQLLDRRAERERAREDCARMAADMDDAERSEIIKGEKSKDDTPVNILRPKRAPAKSRDATPGAGPSQTSSPSKLGKPLDEEAAKRKKEEKEAKLAEQEEKRKEKEEKAAEREVKRKEQEEKKAEREEKREEKRKEMEEMKAQKQRQEQKMAANKAKQATMFGAFFAKQAKKDAKAASKAAASESAEVSSSKASDSNLSDFERMFQPPPQRANVRWAEMNQWKRSPEDLSSKQSAARWTPRDFINDHLSRHNLRTQAPRTHLPKGLKTAPLYGTVSDMWTEYQSAEDPRLVRRRLLNTDKFPRKVLAFDQQARPPYSGTFTRSSLVVGPRTPFEQDPLFDYSYDSGDDWVEDEGGDDVDGGEQDPEAEDDVSEDDEEGEFDDWLDNAEDMLFGPDASGDITMLDGTPPPIASPSRLAPKRKIPVKRITKLNQDCQGPFWENDIGHHPEEEWNSYRIQLINDAPANLDPFKYESSEPCQRFKATFSDTAVGMQIGIKCLLTTTEEAPRKATPTSIVPPVMPLGDASSTANTPHTPAVRRPAKITFPTARLPELFDKIEGSSKIQADLVLELRGHFESITKAAIEAKIREVATREGKGKDAKWRVKNEAWTAAGLSPPARGIMAMLDKA